MKYIVAILLVVFFVQGCTTANSYIDPKGPQSSLAILKGHKNTDTLLNYTAFSVQAIDERNVPYLRRGTLFDFKVTPGQHKILVDGGFDTGWGLDCPCEARLVVTADFEAGRVYRLNGRVQDNRMVAWVEDVATSKRVSNVDEEPYVRSPRDTYYPVYIPIN